MMRRCAIDFVAVVAGAGLFSAAGCGGTNRHDDFIPREDVARTALDAYLHAWSAGNKSPDVPDTNPPVSVIDDLRLKGRTLTGYKILGPSPADAPTCFAVQLNLGNPAEEVRERYVVVGLNPLWVWRYDDYQMITHWCPPMQNNKKTDPARR